MPSGDADPGSALRLRGPLVVGIVVTVLALDQATKAWAVSSLAHEPTSIIGTTVEFRLSRNPGSAFSLFQTLTPLLAVVAVGIALMLVRAMRRTDDQIVIVALALVLAGAFGNLADRLFRSPGWLRGAVVDFIHVGRFPTFNVADSAITIGAVLLVGWTLLGNRSRTRES
ncbi:MAG TPA: signal peptidase II [Acidimicrobiia bacterium]|nr:signal peptidase II [Acidimicrobiia bacterium]